jgi:hypothetical protein
MKELDGSIFGIFLDLQIIKPFGQKSGNVFTPPLLN